MPGPGEYRPDPTECITRIEDLPKPNLCCRSRNYRRRRCPQCGHSSYRDRRARRSLHDLGDILTGRPSDIVVLYSQHYCSKCRKYFNAVMTDLAAPGGHYTRRVVDTAVRLVVEDGLPYRAAGWALWRDHRVFVPYATIQNWVEDGGKKAARRTATEHLDWALSDFSGSIAADELYDGPFCILSLVDNRTFKRLAYHVLSRAPTAKQARLRARLRRLGRLREALEKLLAPGLEKALVFLDERFLGAKSNAVERGNRRYRKMQKTVYRVRTRRGIEGVWPWTCSGSARATAGPRRPGPSTKRGRHEAERPVSSLQCRFLAVFCPNAGDRT